MEKELEVNARRMSPGEQYQIRRNIIRLMRQGKGNEEIAKTLGVSERHVRAIKKIYNEQGLEGIKPKQRGRRMGEQRILTKEQEKGIQKIIVEKHPEQMRMKCALWTRKAIRDLIRQQHDIDMPLSTLGYYLDRRGLSVQRPVKKDRKENPEQINRWMEEEYPAIRERAKAEKGEIYWGDETGIQNTANYIKGYAPKGHTPILELDSQKMKVNLLSAITNRGKLRFALLDKALNADALIDFMQRLVKDSGCKVFFILDNLRVHHAKAVTVWLEKHKAEIEVFYLPPYAPEYNPDEYLNSDLKRDVGKKPMPRSPSDLKRHTLDFLNNLAANDEHIKSYFGASHVRYAA